MISWEAVGEFSDKLSCDDSFLETIRKRVYSKPVDQLSQFQFCWERSHSKRHRALPIFFHFTYFFSLYLDLTFLVYELSLHLRRVR